MNLEKYSNGHDILVFEELMITAINLMEKWESQNFLSAEHKSVKHESQHLACSSPSKQGLGGN